MSGRWSSVLALLVLSTLVLGSMAAPVYARFVGATPFESHVTGEVSRRGKLISVLQPNANILHLGYTPIGPSWRPGPYALGADAQGRDVSARLLYGGRNSLLIAGASACLCLGVATGLSLWVGYVGGWVNHGMTWVMTMLWAIPVCLFASCLSMTMLRDGLHLGPFTVESRNRAIPIFVISAVYLPYASRILTARVRQLKQKTYIDVARGFGATSLQIVLQDILPGLMVTILTFLPLLMALCLLAEAALSFLSLGVQAPDVSLGTMIHDGAGLLHLRPLIAIAPGLFIILTVISLYLVSEGRTCAWRGRDVP